MDKKLYDLMDWAEIEAIVYSEHDHPERVLGPHKVRGGMLVQTFLPGAKSVFAKSLRDGKIYALEEADEAGFFAVIMPGRRESAYELIARYEDGVEKKEKDPYLYGCCIPQEEWEPLANGTHHALYRYLGAHPVRVSGWGENTQASWDITEREKEKKGSVSGVHFAVWAPHALRVSVVGNFNQWDGRRHPMMRMGDTGIFTLFIPDIGCGEIYKYEIKWNARTMVLKSDPFAFRSELRPANASIVTNMARYEWGDEDWLARRRQETYAEKPFLIYEMSLSGWKVCHTVSKKEKQEGAAGFSNYREIAPELARYIKKMGYTHIELFPVMEHPLDESLGYLTTGFYAATARHGSPQDFMYFVDYMHRQGIGVIVDWMATQFPKQENGLAKFDGSALYECESGSEHPYSDALLFNYSNARVCDFLISNAVFWRDVYHLDGLRVPELNAALYLDYGRMPGEWVPNEYGGNENLDAVRFFQKLGRVFHEKKDGALLLAEPPSAWAGVTSLPDDGGLGFDMVWNKSWYHEFSRYIRLNPLFRKGCHEALISNMLYTYSENRIMVFPHDELAGCKQTLLAMMPGEEEEKYANVRVAFGYLMTHPGKKLHFMGQEFGQTEGWRFGQTVAWEECEKEAHSRLCQYVKKLNFFYRNHPALYECDYSRNGFEWISCLDAEHSIIVFLRRDKKEKETLLVVCNFTPVTYENFKVGVPFAGTYHEIFNSDKEEFGGSGCENRKNIVSREVLWDGRENAITIDVAPLGISIFSCAAEKNGDVQ